MSLLINGESIPEELIEGEFNRIKAHFERTLQVACCERDPEFRGYAIDNITSRVLLAQEAAERIPESTPEEIQDAFDKLAEEHGGVPQIYVNLGLPYGEEELLRHQIGKSQRVDKLLREEYAPEIPAEESALRAFYAQHPSKFLTPEEIRVLHISKALRGAEGRAAIYDTLRRVRAELRAGADFLTVATEHNDLGAEDVDLGFFKMGDFMEEFETLAFSMDIGEISPVFSTQLGLHLCTVADRKAPAPKPFEAVEQEIRDSLLAAEREEKFKTLVERLKAKATIKEVPEEY